MPRQNPLNKDDDIDITPGERMRSRESPDDVDDAREGTVRAKPDDDKEFVREASIVLEGIRDISEFVGNTLEGLDELSTDEQKNIRRLLRDLRQTQKISKRILDRNKEATVDEVEELNRTLSRIDDYLDRNKRIEVGDRYLRDVLREHEKRSRKETLASRDISDTQDAVSSRIRGSMVGFMSQNIDFLSRTGITESVGDAVLGSFLGPFAKLINYDWISEKVGDFLNRRKDEDSESSSVVRDEAPAKTASMDEMRRGLDDAISTKTKLDETRDEATDSDDMEGGVMGIFQRERAARGDAGRVPVFERADPILGDKLRREVDDRGTMDFTERKKDQYDKEDSRASNRVLREEKKHREWEREVEILKNDVNTERYRETEAHRDDLIDAVEDGAGGGGLLGGVGGMLGGKSKGKGGKGILAKGVGLFGKVLPTVGALLGMVLSAKVLAVIAAATVAYLGYKFLTKDRDDGDAEVNVLRDHSPDNDAAVSPPVSNTSSESSMPVRVETEQIRVPTAPGPVVLPSVVQPPSQDRSRRNVHRQSVGGSRESRSLRDMPVVVDDMGFVLLNSGVA